jgi:hypothetical protein
LRARPRAATSRRRCRTRRLDARVDLQVVDTRADRPAARTSARGMAPSCRRGAGHLCGNRLTKPAPAAAAPQMEASRRLSPSRASWGLVGWFDMVHLGYDAGAGRRWNRDDTALPPRRPPWSRRRGSVARLRRSVHNAFGFDLRHHRVGRARRRVRPYRPATRRSDGRQA